MRVEEAVDGARERCVNDDNLGFPGRTAGGVPPGVGSVASTTGIDDLEDLDNSPSTSLYD